MSSATLSPTATPDPRRRAASRPALQERPPGAALQLLCFLLGLAMPFISFSQRGEFTRSFVNRVEMVDLVCLALVAALLLSGRLRFTWAFFVYSAALVFSLAIAAAGGSRGESVTAFAALAMAVLYFAVGRSIAERQTLVKALLAGLLASTLIEAVLVLHDYFLPKWFPTSHSDRVRGTFRSTAQLGGYGFTAAGIVLSFGWVYFRSAWVRLLALTGGVMGIFFVLASTRRSGMFALLVWLGLFLILGLKQMSRRAYWVVLLMSLVAAAIGSSLIAHTHMYDRFWNAYEQAASGKSFTHDQFYTAMDKLDMWFPLGVGVGQSPLVMVRYEAHNGHLGVLVEQGLLGFLGYYGLWLSLIRRKWGNSFGQNTAMVKLLTLTFLCGAFVFMIHARQDRDRMFMLFLGLAPWMVLTTELPTKLTRRENI